MRERNKALLLAVLAPLIFAAPMLAGGSGAIYSACVLMAIFASMAYGLDLIVSDLGEVSLAHTVFFAVGSYTTALSHGFLSRPAIGMGTSTYSLTAHPTLPQTMPSWLCLAI